MDAGVSPDTVIESVSTDALIDALIARALDEHRIDDAHLDRGHEPLFSVANELAELFGGSVAIEDLGRRIIAYSSVADQAIDDLRTRGILTRRVPDSPINDDQYRTVLRAERPIAYPPSGDEHARIAVPIRAAGLPLGSIWVIDPSGGGGIPSEREQRLLAAADIAASHMLEDLRVRRATQQPREDRLRALLDGVLVTGAEFAELGLSEERGASLIVFAPEPSAPSTVRSQLRSAIHRHLALHRPETVTAARGGRIYALVERRHDRSPDALIEPLLPVLDRLAAAEMRVALPGDAIRPADVARLRTLADRLFAVAPGPSSRSNRLLTVEALRPALVFDRIDSLLGEEHELRLPEIERMRAEAPATAETLAVWCGCFGNVAQTARALEIHENTVRYRLRQAEERYGVSLGDSDRLLLARLQLRSRGRRAESPGGSD